jgi:hypothetical protein
MDIPMDLHSWRQHTLYGSGSWCLAMHHPGRPKAPRFSVLKECKEESTQNSPEEGLQQCLDDETELMVFVLSMLSWGCYCSTWRFHPSQGGQTRIDDGFGLDSMLVL